MTARARGDANDGDTEPLFPSHVRTFLGWHGLGLLACPGIPESVETLLKSVTLRTSYSDELQHSDEIHGRMDGEIQTVCAEHTTNSNDRSVGERTDKP